MQGCDRAVRHRQEGCRVARLVLLRRLSRSAALTFDELVVVVLQRGALLSHGSHVLLLRRYLRREGVTKRERGAEVTVGANGPLHL